MFFCGKDPNDFTHMFQGYFTDSEKAYDRWSDSEAILKHMSKDIRWIDYELEIRPKQIEAK